jgi:hypothetical protein
LTSRGVSRGAAQPANGDPPMLWSKAKALGLKVYRGTTPCRKSDKHGYLRLTASNKCAACVQRAKGMEADLRATSMDKLKDEVRREIRKELAAEIAKAHRLAKEILKAAQQEALDTAKHLEKVQASRAKRKAAKEALEASPGPVVSPQVQGDDDPEVAPWD